MKAIRENMPLTAIRGLAAAWVAAGHVLPIWFPYVGTALGPVLAMSHTAVDVFFILSGFILMQVYGVMRLNQAPMFWLRRICRIYPLHLSVMAAIALLIVTAAALGRSAHNSHDWTSFGVVTLLLQPFLLGDTPWNPPSWSIGVELLCYVLFPLTLRLMRRASDLLLVCLAAMLAMLEAHVLYLHAGATTGSGAILRGLIGFHLGAALSLLVPRLPVRAAPTLALTGSVGIALGINASSPASTVLSAAVLIFALAPSRGLVAHVLSCGPLVWLGRVSFSIYLLHVQLLSVLDRALSSSVDPRVKVVIFLAILLALSEVTYRFIEQPGRRLPMVIKAKIRSIRCTLAETEVGVRRRITETQCPLSETDAQ